MGTYLNHDVTLVFSEDESYWASQLPEESAGWYSDDDRSDSHDDYSGATTSIRHGNANPDYLKSYGPRISECGRVVRVSSGMYGSFNLKYWEIPNTLISVVSQWDNTQTGDCFFMKTIKAADVETFDWFPGAHRDDYLGSGLEKLEPKFEYDSCISAWSNETWGIWETMRQAAVMEVLPLDIALPLKMVPLDSAKIGPAKAMSRLFMPALTQRHDGVDDYATLLTGEVTEITKEDAIALLQQHGAIIVDKVKQADYILVGANPDDKIVEEAKALDTEIVEADGMFEELVNYKELVNSKGN